MSKGCRRRRRRHECNDALRNRQAMVPHCGLGEDSRMRDVLSMRLRSK